MKLVGLSGAILGVLLLLLVPASAQPPSVLAFKCIAWGAVAPNCANGGLSLEGNSNSTGLTAGTLVSVAGYRAPADGGAGDFVVLGTQPTFCNGFAASNVSGTVGMTAITFKNPNFPTGLVVGEMVSGSGSDSSGTIQIQPGSEIASITTSSGTIASAILTLPLTGTPGDSTTPISVTIVGSNGGTLLLDSASPKDCYQKTNYRGDPHEFGAVGDGVTDDTQPVQYWLGAYGNVFSGAPSAAPASFGPYIATLPANYRVTSSLSCPALATLQGPINPSPLGVPAVVITAANPLTGNFGGSAVLVANAQNCRIGGLAFDANNIGNGTAPIDAVDVGASYVTIDGSSSLKHGYHDLNCQNGAQHIVGLTVKDTVLAGASGNAINIDASCENVRLIGNTVEGATGSGIRWAGTEGTLADGVIQGSGGLAIKSRPPSMASP